MSHKTLSDFSDIYSAYAAGCLDPAFALLVETQAALKPDVARAVARAETIAGIFLETEETTALSAGALDRAFARIDALADRSGVEQRAVQDAGNLLDEILKLPEPLRETTLEASRDSGWKSVAGGVRRIKLGIDSAAEVELYRIEPGRTVPMHSHHGNEFTLVVAGGFSDELGHFGPGDIAMTGPDDTHKPTGDLDGICYALTVRDGGLRFTGMLGFIQRMLGQ